MSDEVDDGRFAEKQHLNGYHQECYSRAASNDNISRHGVSKTSTKWLPSDVYKIIIGVVLVLMIIFNTGVSMSQMTVGRQVRPIFIWNDSIFVAV